MTRLERAAERWGGARLVTSHPAAVGRIPAGERALRLVLCEPPSERSLPDDPPPAAPAVALAA